MIGRERLAELEPHAAGIKAIHVPEAGIVNYQQVCQRLAERVRERDGQVLTSARVTGIERNSQKGGRPDAPPATVRRSRSSTAPGCTATASRR